MRVNETDAIRLLRKLISAEPGVLENGRADPGWCCTEHSIIASLAFCVLGIKAFRCLGKVIVGDFKSRIVQDVLPHYFVLADAPLGVFDSSLTIDSVQGLPIGFSKLYPELGVGLFAGKPSGDDWKCEGAKVAKRLYALYAIQKKSVPDEETLAWDSDTPFGKYLMAKLGTQSGLWAKAGWFTAELMAGRNLLDFERFGRNVLWEKIARAPSKDDFVLGKLAAFR